MVTTIKLELSQDRLARLGAMLTGKKKLATRKQLVEWATEILLLKIDGDPSEKLEMKNFTCPKCFKPIALPVAMPKNQKSDRYIVAARRAADATEELRERLVALEESLR